MHVDAEAVVALPGEVPAYRDIVAGSEGEDVLQVQGFLAAEGALIGELAGRWDRATANAWRGWRRDHGLSADTTLALGQVIFVPQLPRRVTAVDSLVVGAIVSSVEQIGSTVLAAPEFSITLAVGADRIVAAGASVSVRVGEEEVGAVVSDRRSSRDAGVRIELDLVGGCAAWCDSISTTAPQTASGTVRISEPVTGAIVPLGALRSGTGTASAVVMADGTARTVTVRVAVNGQAVVDGIVKCLHAVAGFFQPAFFGR